MRRDLSSWLALSILFVVVVVLVGWWWFRVEDLDLLRGAVARTLARSLDELHAQHLLGMAAAALAAWLFVRFERAGEPSGTDAPAPRVLFGVGRHWGGLGGEDGGWQIDAATIRMAIRVIAFLATLGLSFVLLVAPESTVARDEHVTVSSDAGVAPPFTAPPTTQVLANLLVEHDHHERQESCPVPTLDAGATKPKLDRGTSRAAAPPCPCRGADDAGAP